MIIKTVSEIEKIIFSFFIALLLLLGIFYFFLQEGIEIDSIKIPFVKVQKLYLKLDKKLILKIDKVVIKKNRKKEKIDPKKIIKNISYIKKFFEKIEIKKLSYLNYNVTFLYTNDKLFIDTDDYKVVSKFHIKNRVFLDIKEFNYKKYNLFFKGKSTIDVANKNIFINGKYSIKDIDGAIKASLKKDIINFELNSNSFSNKSLKKITDIFPLNKVIKSWIYKKIVAKSYKVKIFKGVIDLKSKNVKNLFAIIKAKDANIKFSQNLPPVKTKEILLTIKNRSLYFQLEKPTYLDKNLDQSYVTISNIGKDDSYIDIVLKTTSAIDKEILKIVKNYGISLPINQKSGKTKGKLKIRVVFKTNKVYLDGIFETKNSLLNINGIDIYAYNTKIRLKNSNIFIDRSLVEIKKLIKSYIDGKIDLTKKVATINLNNANLKIVANNKKIISIKPYKDILTIDFRKKGITKLNLKELNISIVMKKEETLIFINNLKNIKNFSSILAYIDNGKIALVTKDFKNFLVKAKIFKENDLIYYRGKPVNEFNIEGFINPNRSKLNINDKIKIDYQKDFKITINDYDLNIKDFNNSSNQSDLNFTLYGYSSNIIIFKRKILSQKYIFKYKNRKFDFLNIYKNSKISIKGPFDRYTIDAKNMDDKFIKSFLNIEGIKGGVYNLKAIGKKRNIQGKAIFYNATLKDMALLNNIMAFLNTIPSLVTFSDPGYDKDGYFVKKGKIDFIYSNKILYIKNLNLEGKSLNMQGYGYINLNSSTIDMDLTLITLKNISNILNKIPIAGYILLGKKGEISTKLKIKGSLIKPKISTNIPKEAIKAPLNIIERTIKTPFKLFNSVTHFLKP